MFVAFNYTRRGWQIDIFVLETVFLCVCSMDEENISTLDTESDSDALEKKDGTNCEVKWTQEEVSEILLTAVLS